MSTISDLHNRAMALSMDADVLHQMMTASADDIAAMYTEALLLEQAAADRLSIDPKHEPTRAILYRSAAWMAVKAGRPADARQLVLEGLRGYPPPRVAAELNEVLSSL